MSRAQEPVLIRALLLPPTLPSRIGCRAANVLAAGLDALVRLAQRPRRVHRPRARSHNDDHH